MHKIISPSTDCYWFKSNQSLQTSWNQRLLNVDDNYYVTYTQSFQQLLVHVHVHAYVLGKIPDFLYD